MIAESKHPRLRIRNAHVIDPREASCEPRDLVVTDGRFVSEGNLTDGPTSSIDARDLHAIPGLIDMHVHMTSDPTGRAVARWSDFTDTVRTLVAVDNLACALRSGVTTVRDLGAPGRSAFEIRNAWSRGLFVGARPIVAGPAITATGGHGAWTSVESTGADTIGGLVRANATDGANVIKLLMRSVANPVELSPAEVTAAVDEAHRHGLPVAIHANFSSRSVVTAVDAGCDTLEHGYAIDDETASTMVERGVSLCPTLAALHSIVDHRELWRRRSGSALVDHAVRQLDDARTSFDLARRSGVAVIAGTDAGATLVPFSSLHRELATYVSWGMSPAEALTTATCNAADALGRPDLGGLATGYVADLVLIRGNPLEDIAALTRVEAVVQDGRLVHLVDGTRLTGGRSGAAPDARLTPGHARSGVLR